MARAPFVGRQVARTVARTVARPAGPLGGGRSFAWLQGLVCGVLAMLMPAAAVLLLALLAPGFVALVIDRGAGRATGRAVLLCGAAGAVPALHAVWREGLSFATVLDRLGDPATLAVAWSAAGAGWLLCEVAPHLMRLVLEARARRRAAGLRRMRAALEEDWGIPAAPGQDVPMERDPPAG
jgi:hypothetical protein